MYRDFKNVHLYLYTAAVIQYLENKRRDRKGKIVYTILWIFIQILKLETI